MIESNASLNRPDQTAHSVLDGLERANFVAAFQEHRERLLRMVQLRLDRRLAARVDPSDIVQEVFIRASTAFDEFQKIDNVPMSAWLRIQTRYAVGDCHRRHLHTQKRAAGSENDLKAGGGRHLDESTCAPGLEMMAQSMISPGSMIANQELAERIRDIICQMSEQDQEILILRHIEDISISGAATELDITLEAAKKRHLRALRRLQTLCQGLDETNVEQN